MLRLAVGVSAVFARVAQGAHARSPGGAFSDAVLITDAATRATADPAAQPLLAQAVTSVPLPGPSSPGTLDEAQALLAATLAEAEALLAAQAVSPERTPAARDQALNGGHGTPRHPRAEDGAATCDRLEDGTCATDAAPLNESAAGGAATPPDASAHSDRLDELQRQLDEQLFDVASLQEQLQQTQEVLARAHAARLEAAARHLQRAARQKALTRAWLRRVLATAAIIAACAHAPRTVQLLGAMCAIIVQLTPVAIGDRVRLAAASFAGAPVMRRTVVCAYTLHARLALTHSFIVGG